MNVWYDSSINSNVLIKTYINGFLDVSQNLSARNNLYVNGDASINSQLYVNGKSTFADDISIDGDLLLDRKLIVNGDVSFNSTGRVDVCGNFYAQYPNNSIPIEAIIGDNENKANKDYVDDISLNLTNEITRAQTAEQDNATAISNNKTVTDASLNLKANLLDPMFIRDILVNNITVGRGKYNVDTNTAIGYNALDKTKNNYNTAIGSYAGYSNDTGVRNTFVGSRTDINGNYSESTAVGYQARITASNQIVLGKYNTTTYARTLVTGNSSAFSDRRIKANIVDVPDNLALQQVRDIPCRYYEYIDKMHKGNVNVVGFIAQEVKEVLPSAIRYITEYIPDEYRQLENILWEEITDTHGDITYKMSSDLTDVSGITYQFFVSNDLSDNKFEKGTTGNADNTFTFDASYQYVFCYGKQVDDFHSIDKNQIFALHHSAIQEIDRLQLEEKEKVVVLETKNTELQSQILEEKANVIALTAQIENIMAILQQNNIS